VTAQLLASKRGKEAFEAFVAETEATDALAARRLRPRRMTFHFEHPFDTGGILYSIGTLNGSRPYINPHRSGDVVVSWIGGGDNCQVEDCLTHTPPSDGLHCYTVNRSGAWVSIDFKDRRVAPRHYCLRADKHGTAHPHKPRHWVLQGSEDGESWVTLREHVNDTALGADPMSCAAWSVDPPTDGSWGSSSFFRHVRLYLSGPNSSGTWHFMCAGIELYGQVINQM